MKAPVYILEGTWWSSTETPIVLPYFEALAGSDSRIILSHRTIRNADDVKFYVQRLRKNERAFLYFACHGLEQRLLPVDDSTGISRKELLDALSDHREQAVAFIHFGCCEMVDPCHRRRSLGEIMEASGARWASGYTRRIDWLRSMLFDLTLVSEVYLYFRGRMGRMGPKIVTPAQRFLADHDQVSRSLGFSAVSRNSSGTQWLYPARLQRV
jgi:hypothetical protein